MEKTGYSRHNQAPKINSKTVKHHILLPIVKPSTGNHTTVSQEGKVGGGNHTHILLLASVY